MRVCLCVYVCVLGVGMLLVSEGCRCVSTVETCGWISWKGYGMKDKTQVNDLQLAAHGLHAASTRILASCDLQKT